MRTIKVFAVPESANGHPVPMQDVSDRYVGAVIDPAATLAAKGKRRFIFTPGPHTIPFANWSSRAVQEGHLAPADEETAKLCGVPFDAKAAKKLNDDAEKAKADRKAADKAADKASAKAPEAAPTQPATPETKGEPKTSGPKADSSKGL